MTVDELLSELEQQQVQLWSEGGQIRFRAPRGALTSDLMAELARHKSIVLHRLDGTEENGSSFPLAQNQQTQWFLSQLNPTSIAYLIVVALRIQADIDPEIMRRSMSFITQRHQSLRTTFHEVSGEPVQRVASEPHVALEVLDATSWTDEELDTRLADAAFTPFNLSVAPLWRVWIVKRGPEDTVVVSSVHHIIADAWSLAAMNRELGANYARLLQGEAAILPSPQATYRDFVRQEASYVNSEAGNRDWRYWERQLSDLPPPIELALDWPRPAVQTFAGAVHSTTIDRDLSRELRDLAASNGCTMFTLLLAAYQVLLHRYTGQADIIVGTPSANRTDAEFEEVIGLFANTLPFRARIDGEGTFTQLLSATRTAVLEALDHQQFPFRLLVERIAPRRDSSRPPLFQVWFAFETARWVSLMSNDSPASQADSSNNPLDSVFAPYAIHERGAQFELAVSIREEADTFTTRFTYNTDLFAPESIERMAANFLVLLQAIVAQPATSLAALPLLAPAEHATIARLNDTMAPYPALSVQQQVLAQARCRPDASAVQHGTRMLTYGQLAHQATDLALRLTTLGVRYEDRVGVLFERSPDIVVAQLGILLAGGAFVPLDPAQPAERLHAMLLDAGVAAVVTAATLAGAVPAGVRAICLDMTEEVALSQLPADTDLDQLAYVVYTSGSTGVPKGVAVPQRALVNCCAWFQTALGLHEHDRVSHVAGLGFDISIADIWPTLCAGACLVQPDEEARLSPTLLHTWLHRDRVSVAYVPTPLVDDLLRLPWQNDTPMRVLQTGGDVLRRYPPDGLPFTAINQYGPAETTIWSTSFTLPRTAPSVGAPPIGTPIANTQVYVLDAALRQLPIGAIGELFIGGDGLARGYLNQPELTAARFVPNPFTDRPGARLYRTGDLARMRADGTLEFHGRADRQIKLRGYRIEPGEVETTLRRHPQVRAVVVDTHESSGGDMRLVAYVVPAGGEPPTLAILRAFLAPHLPAYMLPASLVLLDVLPVNSNGKIDRARLPEPVQHVAEPGNKPDPALQRLLAIWEEVLNVRPVRPHDDFFDLGGHSLLGARLFHRIEEEYRRRLPLSTLFTASTPEGLLAMLHAAAPADSKAPFTLVTIKIGDPTKAPIFFLAPVDGSILRYEALARQLEEDQPSYGLEVSEDSLGEFAERDVADLTRDFVQAIHAVRPHGPYVLAGYSSAGVYAFEAAQQLYVYGKPPPLVIMFDTFCPTPEHRDLAGVRAHVVARYLFVAQLVLSRAISQAHAMQALPRAARMQYASGKLRALSRRLRHGRRVPDSVERHLRPEIATRLTGLLHYEPLPYNGEIIFFWSTRNPLGSLGHRDPRRAWRQFVTQISVHRIQSDHAGLLQEDAHLRTIGRLIRARLRRIR